jgi:hypothetical protein
LQIYRALVRWEPEISSNPYSTLDCDGACRWWMGSTWWISCQEYPLP